ncbi:MAG: thioredoxin family protein [Acidobacteriota bacterium]|nr:thioredoxin family protein [Acidobacteriota bacterium]
MSRMQRISGWLAVALLAVVAGGGAAHAQNGNVPFVKQHIYNPAADPHADIAAALRQAQRQHKRVLLDFGGDWCGDCQVLDLYFHQSPNMQLLAQHFVLVHIEIGHMDHNVEVAKQYGVPLGKGVPALAVLDEHGMVLYAQQHGEFENMRHLESKNLTEFLNRWKD